MGEGERTRGRFKSMVTVDLANLYRVYCRMAQLAQAEQDADLTALTDELLRVWDNISQTVTVRVMANGFLEWIRTGCLRVEADISEPAGAVRNEPGLRSNLSDVEWRFVIDVVATQLDTGMNADGIRRTLSAVNTLMGINPLSRDMLLDGILVIVNEAWHAK